MNWASAKMLVIGVVFLFLIQGCGGIPTPEIPKFNRQPHPELKYRKGSLEKELARDYDFFKTYHYTKYKELLNPFARVNPFARGGRLTRPNPILEIEKDLVLLDELAAILKLNHIILTSMYVSSEDFWPELLNGYEVNWKKFFWSPALGTIVDLSSQKFGRSTLALFQLEVCLQLGKTIEHTKEVITSLPSECMQGCICDCSNCIYPASCFRPLIEPNRPGTSHECPFFTEPLGKSLFPHLRRQKCIDWIETKIHLNCLHPVICEKSERYYPLICPERPHESSFYKLFPGNFVVRMRGLDKELEEKDGKIQRLKLQIKAEQYSEMSLDSLRTELEQTKDEFENLKDARRELIDQAFRGIQRAEISEDRALQKLKLAMKLRATCDYVYDNLRWVSMCGMALPLKFYHDYRLTRNLIEDEDWEALGLSTAAELVAVAMITDNPESVVRNRVKFIGSRLPALPENYLNVASYALTQRSQVSRIRETLEQFIEIMQTKYPELSAQMIRHP